MRETFNPLEWYETEYCSKCQSKPCKKLSENVYGENWNIKVLCALANLLFETKKKKVRKVGKGTKS